MFHASQLMAQKCDHVWRVPESGGAIMINKTSEDLDLEEQFDVSRGDDEIQQSADPS